MYYSVYKIINKINGRIYIGAHKTKNIHDTYMGSGKLLIKAINKYGIENFSKEIIFKASSVEEMFEKEKEFVEIGQHTYNIKNGGYGGWDYINNLLYMNGRDALWKRNFSLARKGKYCGEKHHNYGKTLTDEVKAKISQSNKGNTSFLGKHHTEKTKQKISLSKKGKNCGPNNRCWITKNTLNKQIQIGELENYTIEGWRKGRVL